METLAMNDLSVASRILCVDDDPGMLKSLRLILRRFFQVETVATAQDGLIALKNNGPFAVILSDMKMPGMDGTTFLSQATDLAPDTVRVMHTGDNDQKTAIRAVNEGKVFRFVNKPCDPDILIETIRAAIKQNQFVTAERDVLEQTLQGSVKLLTEILAMADPSAFGKAKLLRDYAHDYLDTKTDIGSSRWEIEIAAMLSNLGHITIPRSILEKEGNGVEFTDAERQIMDQVPETGFSLLENIPRLQKVAEIVRYQNKNYDGSGWPNDELKGEGIHYGARLLKVLKGLVEKEASGLSRKEAAGILRVCPGNYDPKILEDCASRLRFQPSPEQMAEQVSTILIAELNNKHILVSPLVTKEGVLIAPSGTTISNLILERIRNFQKLHVFVEPIQVKLRTHA